MFNGHALKSIRTLHNHSRKDLATLLDVSEQAIWQYEQGIIEPQTAKLLTLARHYKVNLQYFQHELDAPLQFAQGHLAYRLADDTNQKEIATELEFLRHSGTIVRYLEQALIAPPNHILELRNRIMAQYIATPSHDYAFCEAISREARDFLKVTHNETLLSALELSGIHILEKDLIGRADAYSAWSSDDTAFIVLGKAKTAVRRNFDLAHELGHLLMHFDIDIHLLDKKQLKVIEREANDFASCFLLPEAEIRQDLDQLSRYSNPDSYLPLKQKYYVSLQALEMRAYRLGYLTATQHNYFYRQIFRKGYKQQEPLDKELPYKRPTKVRYLFDVVLKNHLYSLDDILHHFDVRQGFLEDLFQIESSFFDTYKSGSLPQKLYRLKK